jgi:hypothetical protein
MNAELGRGILAAHSDLYRNLKPRFGDGQHFECGDGWGEILKLLSARLDPYAATSGLTIIQVKEKFGAIRVYFRIEDRDGEAVEAVRRWISEAEERSCETCERCGSPGMRAWRKFGGLLTLCEPCAAVMTELPQRWDLGPHQERGLSLSNHAEGARTGKGATAL